MVRRIFGIPIGIPVPSSLLASGGRILSGALLNVIWRVAVITLGIGALVYIFASNPPAFVAVTASAVVGVVFSDNFRRLVLDIYYRRFTLIGL